jgi:hypothetical protein
MSDRVVMLMAEAMCQILGGRTVGHSVLAPCELCQVGARRAYNALADGGYLRDLDTEVYHQAVVERFGPRPGRRSRR